MIGLHMLMDPQQVKQSYLRSLTFALLVSEIFDGLWLWLRFEEWYEDKDENGMKQVILVLVIAMLFYKIIVFFVLWKASLNFKKFV